MITKTKDRQLLIAEYIKSGQPWPATREMIADWAVENKRFDLAKPSLKRLLASELAEAMSEEYFTTEDGRRVRAKHPFRARKNGKQLVFWDDIRTAPRKNMKRAFYMRRERIAHECKQIKTDVDYYNEIHPKELLIQMPLNFTDDVEEMELAERANRSSSSEPSPQSEQSPGAALERVSSL